MHALGVGGLGVVFTLSRWGRSYKKLAEDVHKGSQILCADGSIVLEVIETDPAAGIVTCKCQNNAKLGCAAHRGLGSTTSAARNTFIFTNAVATATSQTWHLVASAVGLNRPQAHAPTPEEPWMQPQPDASGRAVCKHRVLGSCLSCVKWRRSDTKGIRSESNCILSLVIAQTVLREDTACMGMGMGMGLAWHMAWHSLSLTSSERT